MKWYNYKNEWVNLEHCFNINIARDYYIYFYALSANYTAIKYSSLEERDEEFEKIKKLMGFEEPDNWTIC